MAKNFRKSVMASETVHTLEYTGRFYDNGGNPAECHNGALVVQGAMEDHSVFDGLKDPNVYKITAPAADTDEIHVVDYVDVSHGEIMGVMHREGIKTYGISAPAGADIRVRIPKKHDKGYFAEENFATPPTVGQYAVPTADSTLWTPSASKVTDKTCIKIEYEKAVTEGMVNSGKEYFVTFVNVM